MQCLTTCNIDLFEQHTSLSDFSLVRLMKRLMWCPLIKNRDRRQHPAMIWRQRILLNPPWHVHERRCPPLLLHWLQASGAVNLTPKCSHPRPLGGNVELLWCVCLCVCVMSTDSYREGGNTASDMAQSRASVRVCGGSQCSITMQITAQHFSLVYLLLSIKIKLMHMHKPICARSKAQCFCMLAFQKLTVLLQSLFRPHTEENPPVSLQPHFFSYYFLVIAKKYKNILYIFYSHFF